MVIEHDLPGRDQLERIARTIATEPGELPEGEELAAVLDSAAGLTRVEAENAFSLSLVRHGRVAPDVLWELKAQTLRKSGLMSIHRGGESFADLAGLDALKSFCRRSLTSRPSCQQARPRGVLLLGVPGTGKSAFCKALGNEVGRPTLILDIGSLMGSLVGLTEERTRQALRIADAMAPCIVFVDEIEKGLSGVQASGQTDSGVSARMFGTLLSYLNDHETRRLLRLLGQRRLQAAAGVHPSRALRRDLLPRPAGVAGEGADLAAVPREVRARRRPEASGRPRLHRRRDPGLLPARRAAGRATHGGRGERRPGGRHRRRVGRTPPELGGRPMPVGRPARHLLARGCQPRQGGTQRPSRRPVGQLTPGLSSLRTSSHYSHNSRNALRLSILRIVRISRATFHSAGPARRHRSSTLLITPSQLPGDPMFARIRIIGRGAGSCLSRSSSPC